MFFTLRPGFSTTGSLSTLYSVVQWSKLKDASVTWKLHYTDRQSVLETSQRKSSALCYRRFQLPQGTLHVGTLITLNLLTLLARRRYLYVLFTNNVPERRVSCSSNLGTVTLRTATSPFFTRQRPLQITCTTCFNIQIIRILPTQCICVFCTIMTNVKVIVVIRLARSEWERWRQRESKCQLSRSYHHNQLHSTTLIPL